MATLSNGDGARRSGVTTALGQEDEHWPLHTAFGASQTHSWATSSAEKPFTHANEQGLPIWQLSMAPAGNVQVVLSMLSCVRVWDKSEIV